MIKTRKPIEIDLYLKYRCPNKKCGSCHWITLNESKQDDFIVVCDDCGHKYKPKTISRVSLKYKKDIEKKQQESAEIPESLLNKSVSIMTFMGFSVEESTVLLKEFYKQEKIDDSKDLVKAVLAKKYTTIGENDNE